MRKIYHILICGSVLMDCCQQRKEQIESEYIDDVVVNSVTDEPQREKCNICGLSCLQGASC